MTLDELKNATLEKLGVVPAGGPYPNDDVEKLQQKYEALHAELREIYVMPWWVTEDIPTNVEEAMVSMLAFRAASEYGVPEPRYSRLRFEGSVGDSPRSLAERRLRKLLVLQTFSLPARTEYF